MNILLKRSMTGALCAALIVCAMWTTAAAQKSKMTGGSKSQAMSVKDPKRSKDAARHSQNSAKVLLN